MYRVAANASGGPELLLEFYLAYAAGRGVPVTGSSVPSPDLRLDAGRRKEEPQSAVTEPFDAAFERRGPNCAGLRSNHRLRFPHRIARLRRWRRACRRINEAVYAFR